MVVLLDGDGTLATLALLKSKGVLLVIEPSLGGDKAFVLSRRFGVSEYIWSSQYRLWLCDK
ncbi:hypothetical protein Bca52824_081693 [Brassica carinata]|uniref:Uncharacterized protein n=1 Tax=Brassica carinata TaxID=52824 RepID=A0A8X7PIL4_BRACI|nr:hypothetical protein Bca52824_081693 [Brassica carinata]